MAEASDALNSVGYLVAAAGITLVSLVGYGLVTLRRLAAERVRNAALRQAQVTDDSSRAGG